jgi:hypothetical protein
MLSTVAQPAGCSEATRPKSAYLHRFLNLPISPAVSVLHALIRFWGVSPSCAFVTEPETNGVIERFF